MLRTERRTGNQPDELVRAFDWSVTALGPVAAWPPCQRDALRSCLSAAIPMAVWLGPELLLGFNDAWHRLLGLDHAAGLGQPGRVALGAQWQQVGPVLREAYRDGRPTLAQCLALPVVRAGTVVEQEFIWYISPICDEQGRVVGLSTVLAELPASQVVEGQLTLSANATAAWSSAEAGANIHPDDRARVQASLERAVASGEDYHAVYRYFHQDRGEWLWLEERGRVRFEDGRPVGVSAITHDITTQVAAETALQASEARFRTLVEGTAQIVWTARADGAFDGRQESWERFTGQPFAEYSDGGGFAAIHPDDQPMVLTQWQAALQAGTAFVMDYRLRRHDGVYRFLRFRGTPLHGLDGAIGGWVGVGEDRTEERQRELNSAFLNQISQELARLADADAILSLTCERIAAHFAVRGCQFTEYDQEHDEALVLADWIAGARRTAGPNSYQISDYLGHEVVARLARGDALVVEDTAADPATSAAAERFAALQVGALLAAPYLNRGRWEAALTLHHPTPRQWRPDEVALLCDLAERIWTRVERARVETSLRQREAQLSAFLEHSPGSLFVKDAAGRYRIVNGAFLSATARHLDEVIGKSDDELFGPELAATFRAEDEQVRRSGEPLRFEETFFYQGEQRTFLSQKFPLPDGGIGCVGTDISERRRAEEALRASEGRFRTLFEQAAVGVAEIETATGRFLKVNRRYGEIVGYTREQLEGFSFHQITHPDDLGVDLANMERLVAGTIREFVIEKRYIHCDGSLVWVRLTVSPTWGPGEPVYSHIAVVEDITERKRIEEQLRYANYRFRVAEEAARGFNYEWNLDTGLVTRSESISRVLGYPRSELSTSWQAWAALMEPDNGLFVGEAEAVAAVQRHPEPVFASEYRVRHRDGHFVWVMDRALIVRDEQGRARRLIGQTVDISERKALEAERERLYVQEQAARAAAEEASRLKDEFLTTISHELRTPLTAFLGYTQLLLSRKRDEAYVTRTAQRMLRSAEAQAQLIEDLLDISRIVSGKLRLDPAPVDLVAVIHSALDTSRPGAAAKKLKLELRLDPAAGQIVGDSSRLQQVIWNLLANAVKFTPAGGTITVALERQGDDALLTVRDTGVGISPEFLPHVFDRFRQADGSTSRKHGGLGIGLAIVRHLVELHGGRVEAASEGVGMGATFRVHLPLAADVPPTLAAAGGALAWSERTCPPELDGLRVLVVDDQPELLELIQEVLGLCGAELRLCSGAEEALSVLRQWRPAVLVSDIAMPGRDGYWLIEQVRMLPADQGGATPAVALTAYVRMEDRLNALAAGFDQYVPKPVDPAELRDVVARLVRTTASE